MTAFSEAQVRAALRRVWPHAVPLDGAQIQALGGGVSPRSFLAVTGSQRYVLRMPLAGPPPLLDLATEVRAMSAAASAHCAPAVVAVDLSAGLLLTEYRPGGFTPEQLRRPLVIASVVRLLHTLHRLDVDVPIYAVGRIASSYLAELRGGNLRALSAQESVWAGELERAGRHFDGAYAPTAFCHNDLAAANILGDRAAARLIDFEYAGRGAPLLDLASLAGMNDFGAAERRQLLDEYYGASTAAPALRELDGAIRMLRLLAYFWARVGEARAPGSGSPAQLVKSIGASLRKN